MGILNVTPESFFDGGRYTTLAAAVDHVVAMTTAGADSSDVGGESTCPGADRVAVEGKFQRVLPVITELRNRPSVSMASIVAMTTASSQGARTHALCAAARPEHRGRGRGR